MHARGHPHGDSRYSWSQIDFGIYFLLKVSKIWDLGSAPLASYDLGCLSGSCAWAMGSIG